MVTLRVDLIIVCNGIARLSVLMTAQEKWLNIYREQNGHIYLMRTIQPLELILRKSWF